MVRRIAFCSTAISFPFPGLIYYNLHYFMCPEPTLCHFSNSSTFNFQILGHLSSYSSKPFWSLLPQLLYYQLSSLILFMYIHLRWVFLVLFLSCPATQYPIPCQELPSFDGVNHPFLPRVFSYCHEVLYSWNQLSYEGDLLDTITNIGEGFWQSLQRIRGT